MQLLNSAVNYNEKSINGCSLLLTRRVKVPGNTNLACVEWNLNTNFLASGGSGGMLKEKLHMVALENVELETALAKDLRKDNIIAIKWFAPAPKSRVSEDSSPIMSRLPRVQSLESLTYTSDFRPDPKPKLLIAYAHGVVQLMRNENDSSPIVARFPQLTVTCARWCPNGNFFAVTGQQLDMPTQESSVVHVVTAYGVKLSSLQMHCSSLTGCSWDPTGVKLALCAENLIWFANVRPRYKWGYCGHTVVYSFERVDRGDYRVVFYESKLDESYSKPVRQLEQLATGRDYCIIANRQEDSLGKNLQARRYRSGKGNHWKEKDSSNLLQFFEVNEKDVSKISGMDVREVADLKWDETKFAGIMRSSYEQEQQDSIAYLSKQKLVVLRGKEAEEGISCDGYICSFRGLVVRTVLLDNFLLYKSGADRRFIIDSEIKSLRDAKQLLERLKIEEAVEFIGRNPHPRLWSLLAEVALLRMDIPTAEYAYVKMYDYGGLRFCKRIVDIQDPELRKAEIFVHLGKIAEAENVYLEQDRRDLAISMHKKTDEWLRVLRLTNSSQSASNDKGRIEALVNVADYHRDRQRWKEAADHYELAKKLEDLMVCYIHMDDFIGLENLAKQLPDNHPLLPFSRR
ncbi:hypothetical protein ANCCEY_14222 [Ancylostoma ceylanicum]|uniref:Uncharacterized protein n=1 Tax=Ancylostoma ceylanicum TaxID=53326 RepID=A0A0D6LG96_9BILA|nr:hypothetical protein ANCCEY_14222 [Ancylostoma ceylanicum]